MRREESGGRGDMAGQSDERVNRLKTTAMLATDRAAEEPAGTHF